MTYSSFLLRFLIPPILIVGLVVALRAWVGFGRPVRLLRAAGATLAMLGAALGWTTPWDNALVAGGIWTYPPGRVWGVIGTVPIEEYLFIILQTILVSLWALCTEGLFSSDRPRRAEQLRWRAALLAGGIGIFGALLPLLGGLRWTYLAAILLWATPPMMVQAIFGADLLWRARWALIIRTLPPFLYLAVADALAIQMGIWSLSPVYTTGLHLGPLPLEEGVFFLVTCGMVAAGWTLFMEMKR